MSIIIIVVLGLAPQRNKKYFKKSPCETVSKVDTFQASTKTLHNFKL